MAVPSFLFLAFAAAAALLYALSAARAWRNGVLLVVNLVFLLTFCRHPLELAPYAGFLLAGYALVRLIGTGVGAGVHAAAIVLLVAGFVWLKHYSFIPSGTFLTFDYVTVGLSYVFFRVIHLAIIAREEPEVSNLGLVGYVNYTLSFLTLVSGPIQGYEDYRRTTEDEPASLTLEDAARAGERIVAGLFKFVVLATLVTLLQRTLTARLGLETSPVERVLLISALTAAYPVFLFLNFSGYTSFVIGVARFFRMTLPENFDQPFRAASFIDYWNRWHMSLSSWLKAHVYNPLLLNSARHVRDPGMLPLLNVGALFITFFLIGIWHGQTWHFFVFGVLNGLGVAVNQFYRLGMQRKLGTGRFLALTRRPSYLFVCRGLTFAWVAFTLLWFWSDMPVLVEYARALGAGGIAAAALALILGGAVVIAVLMAVRRIGETVRAGDGLLIASPYVRTAWATLMLLAIALVNVAMAGDTGEVVYKSF